MKRAVIMLGGAVILALGGFTAGYRAAPGGNGSGAEGLPWRWDLATWQRETDSLARRVLEGDESAMDDLAWLTQVSDFAPAECIEEALVTLQGAMGTEALCELINRRVDSLTLRESLRRTLKGNLLALGWGHDGVSVAEWEAARDALGLAPRE